MRIDYDLRMEKWNDRLRQARDKAGASDTDIAKACNVKPPSVHGWMSGDTVNIEAHNLLKACKLLKVSPFWVMNGEQVEAPNLIDEVLELISLYGRADEAGKLAIMRMARATDETHSLGGVTTGNKSKNW